MTTATRAQQNKAKTARYRARMREAGFREIIVWATPAQAEIIRELVKGNRIRENSDAEIHS